ncbi:helix-turn-helix domain-containing protein [Paenibacillus oceani]|uniref:AraC family transcriptional regulator n=1 Tax=Paenibacillus oceani TaxID=2772510 RepID=A0A927CAM0_9BACL|nr:helix-turn-helix domain-containing protein [Paenibacillus oceani]MBD2864165.1 AraC family transcriptional regulator [Paenibacillus oceani]
MFSIKTVIYDDRVEKWAITDKKVPHHILIYVTSGRVVYRMLGQDVTLEQGDILFIPAGTSRSCHNDKELHQKYSAHFTSSGNADTELFPLRDKGFYTDKIHNDHYFRQRFSMLLMQWFNRSSGSSPLICEGILSELIGLIIQDSQKQRSSAIKHELMNRLQTYIVHNHCQPIKLSDLAEYVDRSPNHITKLFKETLGQTPVDYIHQVKIAVACELLQSSRMTIAEISDHLGYCEQSHFHRVFKTITGFTPSVVQKGQPVTIIPLPKAGRPAQA